MPVQEPIKKERLDNQLVDRCILPDIDTARRWIMAGRISVNKEVISQSFRKIPGNARIEIIPARRFVSRGGEKLSSALDSFHLSVKGMNCLDIGSSTGGFTDCLLQNGAAGVSCVDVGYGILSSKLRNNPDVRVYEKSNFRYMTPGNLEMSPFDLITIDVSFISLKNILSPAVLCLKKNNRSFILPLVKPQFEASYSIVSKNKGIITDSNVQSDVISDIMEYVDSLGCRVLDVFESPVKGKKGNKEFFLKVVIK